MTTLAHLRVVKDQLRRGESAVGLCIVFVGLVWGALVGGLLVADAVGQVLTVIAGVLAGLFLFVVRELVLAHASLVDAQS